MTFHGVLGRWIGQGLLQHGLTSLSGAAPAGGTLIAVRVAWTSEATTTFRYGGVHTNLGGKLLANDKCKWRCDTLFSLSPPDRGPSWVSFTSLHRRVFPAIQHVAASLVILAYLTPFSATWGLYSLINICIHILPQALPSGNAGLKHCLNISSQELWWASKGKYDFKVKYLLCAHIFFHIYTK